MVVAREQRNITSCEYLGDLLGHLSRKVVGLLLRGTALGHCFASLSWHCDSGLSGVICDDLLPMIVMRIPPTPTSSNSFIVAQL